MIEIEQTRRLDNQSLIKYALKVTLPLPDAFIEDNDLQPKDDMEIYREKVNGRDALIIIPKKSTNGNLPAEA